MKLQRISILLQPYISKLIKSLELPLICLIGIIISTLPVSWNGEAICFFKIPLDLYGDNRELALKLLMHELFSWAWIFIAFSYLLPRLLSPLGESFLVSQKLWLRLTPCQPHEIAFSRAICVISWGLWIGSLSSTWALSTAFYHHIRPTTLLIDVAGLVSYVFLSGGIILALDLGLAVDYSGRKLLATLALFAPILSMLIGLGLSRTLEEQYAMLLPYASPFTRLSSENIYHFGTATLIGFLLIISHWIIKFRYSVVKNVID
jgi:hypothetical protein